MTALCVRFDPAGSGACLRRYSDPLYFKTVWTNSSELLNVEQFQKEMKVLKRKVWLTISPSMISPVIHSGKVKM